MIEPLEPSLTVYDREVLAQVPRGGDWEARLREGGPERSLWQVAEALDTIELVGLAQVLLGLERFGYVTSLRRSRTVWWRTERGDEAVGS
jgi:hypothetical protein